MNKSKCIKCKEIKYIHAKNLCDKCYQQLPYKLEYKNEYIKNNKEKMKVI